jgi:hypothetical protein
MGRRDRERIERIKAGMEDPVYREKVTNTISGAIQALPTDKQVGILSESLGNGRLQNNRLRNSLETNAPIEMRKGIAKQLKKGITPTVDTLLEEYRGSKSFQKLAASVGLDETWFVQLAEREIANYEVK